MKQGFSLIEIVIVVAIIGGLLALSFGAYNRIQKARAATTTQTRLATVEAEIQSYYDQVGSYPEELNNLVEGPAGKKSNYVPTMQEADLKDAWNQELQYERNKSGYPPYQLWSLGAPGSNQLIYSKGSLAS